MKKLRKRIISVIMSLCLLSQSIYPVCAQGEGTAADTSVQENVSENDADNVSEEPAADPVDISLPGWKTLGIWDGSGLGEDRSFGKNEVVVMGTATTSAELQVYTDLAPKIEKCSGVNGTYNLNADARLIVSQPQNYNFRIVTQSPGGAVDGKSKYQCHEGNLYLLQTIGDKQYLRFYGNSGAPGDDHPEDEDKLNGTFDNFRKYISSIENKPFLDATTGPEEITASYFSGMVALTSFSVPTIDTLGTACFQGCTALTTVQLGNVTAVPASAFDNCPNLTTCAASSARLVDNATVIGESAFRGDVKYISGEINLTGKSSVGASAFKNCGLTHVILTDYDNGGTLTSGLASAVEGCPVRTLTYTTAAVVPKPDIEVSTVIALQATSIADYAAYTSIVGINATDVTVMSGTFNGCVNLKIVGFSDKLTSVPENGFKDCKTLPSISLAAATSIGKSAFSGCTSLSGISLPVTTDLGDRAFSGCTDLSVASIPAVTAVNDGVFYGCSKLATIDVSAAKTFGDDCFNGCPITELYIPDATEIGVRAFNGCSTLTSLTLKDVTSIGADAFKGIGATELVLPAGHAITIGNGAFVGSLKKVKYDDTEKNFEKNITISGREAVFGDAEFEFVKEAEDPGNPDPDPENPDPDNPSPEINTDPEYHSIIWYYYSGETAAVSVEKKIPNGGFASDIPENITKTGWTFEGWYRLETLSAEKPVKWDRYAPVYEDLILCAVYTKDSKTVVIVPDVSEPVNKKVDPEHPTPPKEVDPEVAPDTENRIRISIVHNPLPTLGGTGDPNASGLDGYIDFESFTTPRTLYMVKGQKVKLVKGIISASSEDKKTVTAKKKYIKANKAGSTKLTVEFKADGKKIVHNIIVVEPSVETGSKTVRAGSSQSISVIISSSMTKYPIYWVSSDPDVCTVEETAKHGKAVIRGIGKGKATVTAYINGKAYKSKITVKDAVEPANAAVRAELVPLQTVSMKSDAFMGSYFKASDAKYTYEPEGIVKVDEKGKLKAVAVGQVKLTVVSNGRKGVYNISVNAATPRTVHLNKGKTKSVMPYNVEKKLTKWQTDKPGVVTVTGGKLVAQSTGSAVITATYEGFTFKYYVYVEDPDISATSILEKNGKTMKLDMKRGELALVDPKDLSQHAVFISKNPEIAFCDEYGYVRARYTGKAEFSTAINKKKIKVKSRIE